MDAVHAHGAGRATLLAFAVIVLLVIGSVAAARTRVRPGSLGERLRHWAVSAVRMGMVVGAMTTLTTVLAAASARVGISVFGLEMGSVGMRVGGDVRWALLLGPVAGAAAGFVGSVLVNTLAPRRRGAASTAPPGGTMVRERQTTR